MKFPLGLLAGILIGAIGVIAGYFYLTKSTAGDDLLTITFTEEEIQKKIGRKFPQTERILEIIPIEIQEPQVKFLGDSNRIQISANARISPPFLKSQDITLVTTGTIAFKSEDKTLRTSDVTIEEIQLSSLPENYQAPIKLAMTAAARKYLDDYVVYTIKPEDYKGKMAEMLVKKLSVKKGRLEVTLGL